MDEIVIAKEILDIKAKFIGAIRNDLGIRLKNSRDYTLRDMQFGKVECFI